MHCVYEIQARMECANTDWDADSEIVFDVLKDPSESVKHAY